MNKFILKYVVRPLGGRWLKGLLLLLLWTVSFIALPAISGWFLAMCSVVFVTANTAFAYLIPSATIRLLALVRTATRYFERLENHKTTLDAQQNLQLKIFLSVARLPYFKKQVSNNSALLENSTYGVTHILNHMLLWVLPFTALIISLIIYFLFLSLFSLAIPLEFLVSSAVLLFLVPQLILRKNRKLYAQLDIRREENNQALIESFRGRIEISKYNLEEKAISQYRERTLGIELFDSKLQTNSFYLQMIAGLGFSYIAAFLLWSSSGQGIDCPTAIGIFFGIMAQAELAEMLFSGKSEKSSVEHQIRDIEAIFRQGEEPGHTIGVNSGFNDLTIEGLSATIPGTTILTPEISFGIIEGELIAVFGETGQGKTTLLNSLFYPEYRHSGTLIWNGEEEPDRLPVPRCIYVTQKAYLLTGTLRENFESYGDQEIREVLETVDLAGWLDSLPDGLETWIGENGEILSGGQRKKLLLAQALLKKPQLLVVDEPTAGISAESAIEIFRNIRLTHPRIAIVMATHLKDFERIADRVVYLR